jgi:ethanolamine utilization protein EutQ (cupin superfamily)
MVPENKDSTYDLISDRGGEDRRARPHTSHLRAVGLIVCAVGIFASAVYLTHSPTVEEGSNPVIDAAASVQQMTFGASPHFRGSTAEFFIDPAGRLLASLEPGSNSTMFVLDHRLQYVVEGEIHITDGTGQSFVGKAGDIFYLPYGSKVTYFTPKSALTYVVVANKEPPILPTQLSALSAKYKAWMDESARATTISHFSNIRDRKSERFQEYSKEQLSSGASSAFFDEIGCFKWTGEKLPSGKFPSWNLCGGIFYLKAGPPFTSYTYNHHYEVDFVLDGEFHYKAPTSQALVVTQGDLVHNPRKNDIHIGTPDFGKFLTISLSDVDDFWR